MTHPDPPKQAAAKTAHRPADDPGRAIADALARDQDALRGDMEAIGRDFRKALTRPEVERGLLGMASEARQLAISRITELALQRKCPICGQRLITAIGLEAHLSVGHSWWERVKHWAKRWRKP